MRKRMQIAALIAGLLLPLAVAEAPALANSAPAREPIANMQPLPKRKAERSVDPARRGCTCPRGYFCAWPQTNCRGHRQGGNRSHVCYVSRLKRSAGNAMGHAIRLYQGTRCNGRSAVLPSGRWANYAFRSVRT